MALNSLRLFEELHLTGGVLRIDGEVVAFTIGEPICEDTYVVHIEKAYADVQGAYTMINQQFVEHECMNYKYVNREDDTGAEGLSKTFIPSCLYGGKGRCDRKRCLKDKKDLQ